MKIVRTLSSIVKTKTDTPSEVEMINGRHLLVPPTEPVNTTGKKKNIQGAKIVKIPAKNERIAKDNDMVNI